MISAIETMCFCCGYIVAYSSGHLDFVEPALFLSIFVSCVVVLLWVGLPTFGAPSCLHFQDK
jgi:hypothetical protein